MSALFLVVLVLGLVGTLQVWLDRRARKPAGPIRLCWRTTEDGPRITDLDGRPVHGIRSKQYVSALDSVDVIRLETLAHHPSDGSYLILGRKAGGPRK